MTDEQRSPEWQTNLWAPWRMEYIESLGEPDNGKCFLCDIRDHPAKDEENFLIWRGRRSLTILNRFPYAGGHSLIAPLEHVGELGDLDDATVLEMMGAVRDIQQVLAQEIHAQGFNVGINVGRCAGAGLPGHLHIHVVPRWNGDTNFVTVFGDIRVIPDALARLRERLCRASEALGLPKPPADPDAPR